MERIIGWSENDTTSLPDHYVLIYEYENTIVDQDVASYTLSPKDKWMESVRLQYNLLGF